ncbi:unnamed protein product [Sphagnum troendelagicum]|uniref:NYN domain-containing protein n=1 Tax=Sphagnum troendelagicum TaxID=128251 RepID=A0ABP0TTA1_9BRYO
MLAFEPAPILLLSYRPPAYHHSRSGLPMRASGQHSNDPEPVAPRITSNVKRNLQLLKLFREFAKKESSSPRPTTSYRKKKTDKQDLPDDVDTYEDPTTRLYHTDDGFEFARPVLLVDGYNMCGFWPKLKKYFSRGDLEGARDKLINELITFTHIRGVKVVVVFDATMSGLPNHKEAVNSVDVVYAATSDSDSWIEREVLLLRADGCPKVWVATSDSFHQQAAHGSGAYVWNCKTLISEIKDARKQLQALLHDDSMYSTKGKLLEHNLDPEVRDALQALKHKLAQVERS